MNRIASDEFDARTMCGTLCLQHKVNEYLWDLKDENGILESPNSSLPMHVNFI
jgi:hypothetical protein